MRGAEEWERFFGRLPRLRNANTKSKRGSSLGLYLCARIARQHDGTLTATSEPGRWARFTLDRPAAQSPGD